MIPGDEYFEGLYADSDDPWDYAHDRYERRKYEITLAALPRERYGRAWEPGCSVGEFTAMLAERCDHVLAEDRVPRAVELARGTVRRRGVSHRVDVRVGDLRSSIDGFAPGSLDLVVLGEVLYYVPADEAAGLAVRAAELVAPGGALVLVHWRGLGDHACTGGDVHAAAVPRLSEEATGLTLRTSAVDEGFLLDVFEKR